MNLLIYIVLAILGASYWIESGGEQWILWVLLLPAVYLTILQFSRE